MTLPLPLLLPTVALAAFLSSCATPAASVKVQTMPMVAALEEARTTRARSADAAAAPISASAAPVAAAGDPPRPIVTAPDVRLAYLYEWVDAEGNRHFGGWVAIAVTPPRWILSDGAAVPLEAGPPTAPLATERSR